MNLIRTYFLSDNVLKTLARELHHFQLSKTLMDWDLEDLEEVSCSVKRSKFMDHTTQINAHFYFRSLES
jgi:hypothetical protein